MTIAVTCAECGAQHEVADHTGEHDWLYDTEDREAFINAVDPAGNPVQLPHTYPHRVARYFVWKCDAPVHGKDGYVNRVTEPIEEDQ